MSPKYIIPCLLVSASVGCAADTDATTSPSDAPDAGRVASPDASAPREVDVRSRAPALKKKSGEQLSQDLAQALDLERDDVCRELGLYDCAQEAHRIVLGGVEPYSLRIDEPLPGIGVSAPIAADRVALSACAARARADFEGGASPIVFGPLVAGDADGRSKAVEELYQRLLARAPDPEEMATVAGWTATNMTDQDFATLTCFMVATTLEHLFY